jgi:hypothetical protein
MKNWKQFTFVAIIAIVGIIMGFVACDSSGNNDPKTFTVTIGSLTNGSIVANPTSGVEGTEITLTVNPENIYRLKSGTLKHGTTTIDETTLKFSLPASNVTVTAQFESLFIGTWNNQEQSYKIIFNENTYIIKFYYINTWCNDYKGTFSFTETELTLKNTHYVDNYIVNNDQWLEWDFDPVKYEFDFIDNNYFNLTRPNVPNDSLNGIWTRIVE